MNAPEIKEGIGAVTYLWKDMSLKVRAERIEDTSAELWFFSTNGTGDRLLHVSKSNLLATTTMNTLARRLRSNAEDVPWDDVLTFVAAKTLEIVRRGEDIQEVGDEPESMSMEYTLRPILEYMQPTTIYAPGGTGKSKLGVYIACLIHFNLPGVHGWVPEHRGNVLYLDWEADAKTIRRLTWATKIGLDCDLKERFFYRRCYQPLISDIEEIRRMVTEKQIEYVIVDSQMAATRDVRGDPSTPASEYHNALRSLGVGSLTLDHVNKEGGNYGSVTKTNRARSQFELKGAQEPGQKFIDLALIHRKRNEGMLLPAFGFRVEFDSTDDDTLRKITFTEANVMDNPTLAKAGTSIRARAKDELLRRALTLEDLAGVLDEPAESVKVTLYRYKDDFIYRKNDHTWAVLISAR